MSWSYSGNPGGSDLDLVRFLIGDTDTNDQQLTDEEINYLLTAYGSPQPAALAAIDGLISKFSRYANQRTGDISVDWGKIVENYRELARTIRRQMKVAPYAGGITISDKEIDEENEDLVQPAFARGFMDNE